MFIGLIALLFLVEVFGIAPKANATQVRCPTGRIPNNKDQGENIAKNGKPLYKLSIEEESTNTEGSEIYTLKLQGQRHKKFRDVFLAVEAENKTCGTGSFHNASKYLYQPTGCPHVISTERKEKMTRTHFDWTAPKCGCVVIRAVVHSVKGKYYSGNSSRDDDPLTVTKCIHVDVQQENEDKHTTLAPMPTGMMSTSSDGPKNSQKSLTRADRLETLCENTAHLGGASLADSRHFRHRHQLTVVSDSKLEHIKLILESRRSDIRKCCSKNGRYRNECIGDIRRRRIDRFCARGEPDIPFNGTSVDWMRDREDQCCWVLGGERYDCFSVPPQNKENTQSDLVNPMDEFDPVNDVDDYLPQTQTSHLKGPKEGGAGVLPDGKLRKLASTNEQNFLTTKSILKTVLISTNKTTMPKTSNGHVPDFDENSKRKQKELTGILGEMVVAGNTQTSTGSTTITPPSLKVRQKEDDIRQRNSAKKKVGGRYRTGQFLQDGLAVMLQKKAWRANLKSECCRKGQEEGIEAAGVDVLPKCMHNARKYSSEITRGRRLCGSYFMMCCANSLSRFSRKMKKGDKFGRSRKRDRNVQPKKSDSHTTKGQVAHKKKSIPNSDKQSHSKTAAFIHQLTTNTPTTVTDLTVSSTVGSIDISKRIQDTMRTTELGESIQSSRTFESNTDRLSYSVTSTVEDKTGSSTTLLSSTVSDVGENFTERNKSLHNNDTTKSPVGYNSQRSNEMDSRLGQEYLRAESLTTTTVGTIGSTTRGYGELDKQGGSQSVRDSVVADLNADKYPASNKKSFDTRPRTNRDRIANRATKSKSSRRKNRKRAREGGEKGRKGRGNLRGEP